MHEDEQSIAASSRRPVVTGRCASNRPLDEHTTARIIVSLARDTAISGNLGFAARGRSDRSRRTSATPASRCRVRPSAPPRCGRGPPAGQGRRTRRRPPPRAAPARRRRPVSTNTSEPNTAPVCCRSYQASGPLPARHGAQRHPVVADPLRVASTPKRSASPSVQPTQRRTVALLHTIREAQSALAANARSETYRSVLRTRA